MKGNTKRCKWNPPWRTWINQLLIYVQISYLKQEKNPESATRCKLRWFILSFETITKSFCTYLLMDPLNYSLFYHVLLCNVTIYSGKNVTDSSLLTISFSFLTVNFFDPSRSSSMVHKIWIYFSKIPKFLFIIQRQWENNFE